MRERQLEPVAPNRLPSLPLVDSHAHAGVVQVCQRRLHPVVPDEPGDIAKLDPRVSKERQIRAVRVLEDCTLEQNEEGVGAPSAAVQDELAAAGAIEPRRNGTIPVA